MIKSFFKRVFDHVKRYKYYYMLASMVLISIIALILILTLG